MTHEHEQPAAGHLQFPGGGIVTGNSGAPVTIPDDVPTFPFPGNSTAEFIPPHALGTAPSSAAHGRRREGDTVHTMPSGHTVTVAPLETLTRRDRTALLELNRRLSEAEDPERGKKILDEILARIIIAWTYPWALPSQDPEALERLPMTDVWDVEKLAARADKLLFVGPVTPDDHADATSPTAPSGE